MPIYLCENIPIPYATHGHVNANAKVCAAPPSSAPLLGHLRQRWGRKGFDGTRHRQIRRVEVGQRAECGMQLPDVLWRVFRKRRRRRHTLVKNGLIVVWRRHKPWSRMKRATTNRGPKRSRESKQPHPLTWAFPLRKQTT